HLPLVELVGLLGGALEVRGAGGAPGLGVVTHEVEHVHGAAVVRFRPGAQAGEGLGLVLPRQQDLPLDGAQVAVDFRRGESAPRRGVPQPEGEEKAQAGRADAEGEHSGAPWLVAAAPSPCPAVRHHPRSSGVGRTACFSAVALPRAPRSGPGSCPCALHDIAVVSGRQRVGGSRLRPFYGGGPKDGPFSPRGTCQPRPVSGSGPRWRRPSSTGSMHSGVSLRGLLTTVPTGQARRPSPAHPLRSGSSASTSFAVGSSQAS